MTTPNVTFIQMKENFMQNGQLKPGNNVPVSSKT